MGNRVGAVVCALALAASSGGCSEEIEVQVAKAPGGTGGAGVEGLPTEEVQAKVSSVAPQEVVLEDADGRRYYLAVGPHTAVTRDGQGASLLVLKPGTPVEAEFVNANGDMRATELRVVAAGP